jgi:hypothetical protein
MNNNNIFNNSFAKILKIKNTIVIFFIQNIVTIIIMVIMV